jgi:hypothetical protein
MGMVPPLSISISVRHFTTINNAESMDQISIKTPNPNCRLYWSLIEFVVRRYSHVGIFDPFCELAPLLFTGSPTPAPFPVCIHIGSM